LSVYQRDDGEVVIARMNSGLMSNLFKTNISQVMGLATSQVEGIIVAATALNASVRPPPVMTPANRPSL